jgi:SulP family sulfate permease
MPMLRRWPLVDRRSLRADALAGLLPAAIILVGVCTANVPVIIAALFVSPLHLVLGPTAALSQVIFATINPIADPGSVARIQHFVMLSLLTGMLTLTLGVARLGLIVNLISHTVMIGFTAGAALLIAASQLKNLLGLKSRATSAFTETLAGSVSEVPNTNPCVLGVGAVSRTLPTPAWGLP